MRPSASGVRPNAMPMLESIRTEPTAKRNGWPRTSRMRRPIVTASSVDSSSRQITTNSSPPTRAKRVDAADRAAHVCRDAAQQLVAERVAEPVVDLLEPVEVDVQRGGQRALFEDRGQHLEQLRAVRDAGQRIAPCFFGEPLLERAALGHVGRRTRSRRGTCRRAGARRSTGSAPTRAGRRACTSRRRARRATSSPLVRDAGRARDPRFRLGPLGLVDEVEQRTAEHLGHRRAEQVDERVVGERGRSRPRRRRRCLRGRARR